MGIVSHPIVRTASASFLISSLAVFAAAQQRPKVLAPHDPVAPEAKINIPLSPIPRSIAGGPWIVDSHFESIIYLKNVVENASITVTPVLYLSNGTKYQLSPVQIAPSGIATIDVGASLNNMGVAPLQTLSGWVELQYNWAWDPLCAYLKVVDVTGSLVFSFGFAAPGPLSSKAEKAASQVREGMWWKQEKNVTGFLTLANTTPQAMNATVDIEDNHAAILGTHIITVPPQGMATLDMLELQATSGTEGGIRVRWVGATDGLLVNGGLEDVGVGYSASLPFKAPERPLPPMAHKITPQSFAELGLMTGAADPYMNFSAETIFTPYSVLRNVSGSPISVTPTLWWTQGSTPASFQLPSIRLLPSQTYSLDMPSLLASAGLKNFSGSLNLVLDTQGQPGLLMASGSVDQTNTYVFEVSSRGIANSAGKSMSYWSTGNGDDTMVTIWNPADEAQTFIFRLIFAGGHYDDVMALGPRATAMFDISDIIRTAGADPEGNIIPAGTQEGSAEIIGLEADNQHILLAVDSGIYNVRKATCNPPCTICNGATGYDVSLDPFGVPVNGQAQESLIAQWNNGHRYDDTNVAAWSSSDMSIATVQTGLVKGVSPGSMTIHAITAQEPVYAPYCGPDGQCPDEGGGGTAPGNVITVTFSALQAVVAGQSAAVTATVNDNTTGQTITLALTPSGTGSATFSNGSTTMSITSTTTATILGVHPSTSAGDLRLDATIPGSEGSGTQSVATNPQSFSVVAIPVSFSQSSETNQADGTLYFIYTWKSSTGNLQDLLSCTAGEQVAYPTNENSYIWPYPMAQSSPNPTVLTGPASSGTLQDHNYPPGSYSSPYSPGGSFTATQNIFWDCPLYQDGSIQDFVSGISITRSVNQNPSTHLWQYQITKSGYTNTVTLPNQ